MNLEMRKVGNTEYRKFLELKIWNLGNLNLEKLERREINKNGWMSIKKVYLMTTLKNKKCEDKDNYIFFNFNAGNTI